jgi:hypothetical protein
LLNRIEYLTVAVVADVTLTEATVAAVDCASVDWACALMVEANCCPFWSRAIFCEAPVVPSKNLIQFALMVAALAADEDGLGLGLVVEALDEPQAAATVASARMSAVSAPPRPTVRVTILIVTSPPLVSCPWAMSLQVRPESGTICAGARRASAGPAPTPGYLSPPTNDDTLVPLYREAMVLGWTGRDEALKMCPAEGRTAGGAGVDPEEA